MTRKKFKNYCLRKMTARSMDGWLNKGRVLSTFQRGKNHKSLTLTHTYTKKNVSHRCSFGNSFSRFQANKFENVFFMNAESWLPMFPVLMAITINQTGNQKAKKKGLRPRRENFGISQNGKEIFFWLHESYGNI